MNFQTFELFVTELSAPVAHLAKRYFRKPFLVEEKADSSPVTKADKEIEAFIRGSIEKSFPDHGIIGEEHGNQNDSAEYVWVIDPIDGTKAFIAGEETFTTLIGLCHNNVPIFGAIYQPVRDELWLGDGKQTSFNNILTRAKNSVPVHEATIATTSGPYFSDNEKKRFQILENAVALSRHGGDGYLAGLLANGEYDMMCDVLLKPYDAMALIPILKGCGATVSDWQGEDILLGQPTYSLLAAGDKTLHNAALKVLQSAS